MKRLKRYRHHKRDEDLLIEQLVLFVFWIEDKMRLLLLGHLIIFIMIRREQAINRIRSAWGMRWS